MKVITCILFIVLFVIIVPCADSRIRGVEDKPVVKLPGLGSLRGKTIKTAWSRREVKQFTDVKYAESTGGKQRFQPPIPAKPWRGVRDATKDGIGCPSVITMEQIEELTGFKDMEDCLSMTITTPNLSGKLPVMVYLHGEYLYEGNNLEGAPEYLLEKDIVLVAPQYRLGPFGFLSTLTREIPGNAAVFDVILALRWIKHFIPNFGGDPKRITVFGQVGGAAIAHLLTLSPAVPRDLFDQVIYHSGSALMPTFITSDPIRFSKDIGIKAGCDLKTIDDLNTCLTKLSTSELIKGFIAHAQENAHEGIGNFGGVQFTIGGPSGILPHHPTIILLEERNMSYPAMGGAPKNAGSRAIKEIYESDFEGAIPDAFYKSQDYINHIIMQTVGLDVNGVLTTFVERELFSTSTLKNGTFKAMLPGLIDLAGIFNHKAPVLMALKRNAKHLAKKTFLYSFDYKGQFNRYPDFEEDVDTPFHGGVSLTDESIYLFPYPEQVKHLNTMDTKIAKQMVDLWTSFATTGVPTLDGSPVWPPLTNINGPYFKIDENVSIGKDYFDEFSVTVRDEMKGISLVK